MNLFRAFLKKLEVKKSNFSDEWHFEYPELRLCTITFGEKDIKARLKAHDFVKEFLKNNKFNAKANGTIPNNIYMYWDQGWNSAPAVVQSCRRQAELMSEGFNLHFLDFHSASQLVNIPKIVRDRLRSNPTKYSNIVRCDLLSRYGGIWIDATVFITTPLLQLMPHIENRYFSYTRKDQILSNWMMISPQGHIIPTLMRDVQISWWLKTDELPAYRWFHYLFEAFNNLHPEFKNEWNLRYPISSSKAYLLAKFLNHEYNEEIMQHICKYTFVQKLSYYKEGFSLNPKDGNFAKFIYSLGAKKSIELFDGK
jgi:hypothetical protein